MDMVELFPISNIMSADNQVSTLQVLHRYIDLRKGLIHWIYFRTSIIESWPEEQLIRSFLLDILGKIICKKKFIEHSRCKLKHMYSHHNKRFASSNLPGLKV